jgi:hypothetical protein
LLLRLLLLIRPLLPLVRVGRDGGDDGPLRADKTSRRAVGRRGQKSFPLEGEEERAGDGQEKDLAGGREGRGAQKRGRRPPRTAVKQARRAAQELRPPPNEGRGEGMALVVSRRKTSASSVRFGSAGWDGMGWDVGGDGSPLTSTNEEG